MSSPVIKNHTFESFTARTSGDIEPYSIPPLDEATKYDEDKTRLELLPPEALIEIGKVLGYGAKKYNTDNWRNGFKWRRLVGSCLRHLMAWAGGEDKDPETGLSHLAHAGANILFLITHEVRGLGEDDRPSK